MAELLTHKRIRCHAAVADGRVTAPAIVEIGEEGTAKVSDYNVETHSTTDFNGVIMLLPPETDVPGGVSAGDVKRLIEEMLPASAQGGRKAVFAVEFVRASDL